MGGGQGPVPDDAGDSYAGKHGQLVPDRKVNYPINHHLAPNSTRQLRTAPADSFSERRRKSNRMELPFSTTCPYPTWTGFHLQLEKAFSMNPGMSDTSFTVGLRL